MPRGGAGSLSPSLLTLLCSSGQSPSGHSCQARPAGARVCCQGTGVSGRGLCVCKRSGQNPHCGCREAPLLSASSHTTRLRSVQLLEFCQTRSHVRPPRRVFLGDFPSTGTPDPEALRHTSILCSKSTLCTGLGSRCHRGRSGDLFNVLLPAALPVLPGKGLGRPQGRGPPHCSLPATRHPCLRLQRDRAASFGRLASQLSLVFPASRP